MAFSKTFRNYETGRRAHVFWDSRDNTYEVVFFGYGINQDPEKIYLDEHDGNDVDARQAAVEAAEEWVSGHATNVEALIRVMEEARSGPLMQAFIMDALVKAAEEAKDIPDNAFGDSSLISAPAWRACAQELHEVLEKHLQR